MGIIGLGNIGINSGRKIIGTSPLANFGILKGAPSPLPYLGDSSSWLFGGTDERIGVPNGSSILTGAFSVSAWFRLTQGGQQNAIIGDDLGFSTNRSWLLFVNASDQVGFVFWDSSGTANQILSTPTTYANGQWYHAVATWDGTTDINKFELWINAVLIAKGTASGTAIRQYNHSGNDSVTLGAVSSGLAGFIKGNIDEPAVWDGVKLSSTQISEIYNNGSPIDLTPYAPTWWWRSEYATWDGSNWQLPDAMSTGLDMVSRNMEQADRVTNIPATSLFFDGVDERTKTADDAVTLTGSGGISFSFWIRVFDTGTNNQMVFTKYTGANLAFRFQYNGSIGGTRKMAFFYEDGAGASKGVNSNVAGEFEDASWHHVVGTTDCSGGANTQKIYVDGVLSNSTTPNNAGFLDFSGANANISMASQSNGNNYGACWIMQAIIFDGVELSADDVSDLYNSGFPASDSVVNALSPTSWWKLGNEATWDGSNWTVPDQVGSADMTSVNIEEGDKSGEAP